MLFFKYFGSPNLLFFNISTYELSTKDNKALIFYFVDRYQWWRALNRRSACVNITCPFRGGWKVGDLPFAECVWGRCLRSLAVAFQQSVHAYLGFPILLGDLPLVRRAARHKSCKHKHHKEGLGRVIFVAGALEHERQFLAPSPRSCLAPARRDPSHSSQVLHSFYSICQHRYEKTRHFSCAVERHSMTTAPRVDAQAPGMGQDSMDGFLTTAHETRGSYVGAAVKSRRHGFWLYEQGGWLFCQLSFWLFQRLGLWLSFKPFFGETQRT